jgi:hypothetical protein
LLKSSLHLIKVNIVIIVGVDCVEDSAEDLNFSIGEVLRRGIVLSVVVVLRGARSRSRDAPSLTTPTHKRRVIGFSIAKSQSCTLSGEKT